ncbi:MAG: hypothetical protein KJO40_18320 [Deltaproteobacteria bacterium]|nr:hypothetical protein [Deltaproteobacteria bacterium]
MNEEKEFLETLAATIEDTGGLEFPNDEAALEVVKQLRSLAVGIEEVAFNRRRVVELENRVDDALSERIESWLETRPDKSSNMERQLKLDMRAAEVAATWLLSRRTQAAGTKSMFGQGLGSIGAAAVASILRGAQERSEVG